MSTFAIRPCRLDDLEEVFAAADESREHISKWMGWMTPDYSKDDTRRWLEMSVASWEQGDAYEHLIFDTADGSIAGACGLTHLNRVNGVCNLGYWVRASRIGEGAARQAALLLRDFGFATLEMNRLEIVVALGNRFSRMVAESTGALYEGVQRMRLKVGEVAHDTHMFALLNPAAKRNGSGVEGSSVVEMKPKPSTAKVSWIDMIVKDPDQVSRFHAEVIGLTREAIQEDSCHTSYALRDEDGVEVLGICDEAVFPDWVAGWLPYVDIGDFDMRVAKVEAAGGVIIRRMTMDYRWQGQRFCLVKDPSGAPIMLCEAASAT